jgi:hypothetical protein
MRYTHEDRVRTYLEMDALRKSMEDSAHNAVYALNGDAVGRAREYADNYFSDLEKWQELGRVLDANPPEPGTA